MWTGTRHATSAQNTGENGRQHMGEPNAGLCRTLSLAACAWTKRHRRTFVRQVFDCVRAHSGRIICFGVRKLWLPSRCANVAETDCVDILEKFCQVDFVVSFVVNNNFVCVWLSYCHSVTVSSVRYTKHCVDGQPSEHSLWHTLVWCCLADRLWQQCPNRNWLALLLMTSDITQYRTWYSSINLTCILDN